MGTLARYEISSHARLNGEHTKIRETLEHGAIVNSGRIENVYHPEDGSMPVQLTVYGKECWFLSPEYGEEVAQAIVDYQDNITADFCQTAILYEPNPYFIVQGCLRYIDSVIATRYPNRPGMDISSGHPDRIALLLRYFYGTYPRHTVAIRTIDSQLLDFVNELPISVFSIQEIIEKAKKEMIEQAEKEMNEKTKQAMIEQAEQAMILLEREVAVIGAGTVEFSVRKSCIIKDGLVTQIKYSLVQHRDTTQTHSSPDEEILLEEVDLSSLKVKTVISKRMEKLNKYGAPQFNFEVPGLTVQQQMLFEALVKELLIADEQEY